MRHCVLWAVLAALAGGCRAQQLAHDQDHIRASVMHLHESQLMDNLVRARKGLPILHLDYTNMTGTVTQTGQVSGGGSQTVVSNRFFNIPATVAAMSRVVTGVGNLSSMGMQVNQLTLTAQPVITAPEVYNAYLNFIKEPDRLRESPCPPPCEAALIVRCYDAPCPADAYAPWWKCWAHKDRPRVYYWVPVEYAADFQRLSLYTVAVRGQPAGVTPNFEVTVRGVLKPELADKDDPDVYLVPVKIDRKVPNDRGYMIATLNGRVYEAENELKVVINRANGLKPATPGELDENQKTDVVILSVSLKKLNFAKVDDLVRALADKKVALRFERFVPTGPVTDRLLEDIRSQLELFRLGQQQPR